MVRVTTSVSSLLVVVTVSCAWRASVRVLAATCRVSVFVSRPLVCTTETQSCDSVATQDTLEITGMDMAPPAAAATGMLSWGGRYNLGSPANCPMVIPFI
ncbi:MAG: hypothetical protein BWX93_01740 [Bacteroidetes bacterium ADurb.Bin139]|nr:MAG: hypothetical protein BWX93_01740 [Bacteroidetes bacterium ADurb.Bin139]